MTVGHREGLRDPQMCATLNDMNETNQTQHPQEEPAMLSTGAVARRLGVSKQTVRRLIEEGQLPALRVSKHYRVSETDLASFIESRKR